MKHFLLFAASATAIHVSPLAPIAPRAPRLARIAPLRLAEDDSAADRARVAAEKRLVAERLALEAERAALEAEKMSLEAEQLKLQTDLKKKARGDYVEPPPPAPPPAAVEAPPPALAPPPPAPSEPAESSPLGFSFGGGPANNASAGSEPPPMLWNSALAQLLERVDEKEAELQLTAEQIAAVKDDVFGIDSFYLQRAEPSPLGTVFRGNLRADSDVVFQKVQDKLAASSKLKGVRLLLLLDPLPLTLQQLQDGEERQPVFLALPPQFAPPTQGLADYGLAAVSLFATTFTTLGFALSAFLLSDDGALIDQLQAGDPQPIALAAPIAVLIGGLQLAHEGAHLAAAAKAGLKVGVPIALPSLQLGVYGCITRLLSFPKNRADLLDFALAGPAVGGLLSLGLYAVGLALSGPLNDGSADLVAAAAAAGGSLPVLPSGFLQSSLLLGGMAQAFIPSIATSPTVTLDPLAVAGFASALLNALQLLPIGRLDGGRVALAALGTNNAGIVSGVALLLLGLQTILFGDNPILLFFGLIIIFFQRAAEVPAADDITDVDDGRKIAAAIGAVFMVLTLLPFPAAAPLPPVNPSDFGF